MIRKAKSWGERGDTIVEVLMCVAVAGAVLASSFALVNRTARDARNAQEHEQALKVAESQVEQLKDHINNGKSVAAVPLTFCFGTSGYTTSAPCLIPSGSGYNYEATISSQNLPVLVKVTNGTVYTATVDWDGPGGSREHVEVVYKVYK